MWEFMGAHPFLTFIIVYMVLVTVETCVKALCRRD